MRSRRDSQPGGSGSGATHSLPDVDVIDGLPLESLPAMIASLAALQARAAGRLASVVLANRGEESERRTEGDGRLLTIPQVAEVLHVAVSYGYELARRELPSIRFGKYVRVRQSDLEAWIKRGRDQ